MQTKPNPFSQLVSRLEETHLSGTKPSFEDPAFSALLDSYTILQQCALTHHLQSLLAPDPDRPPESGGKKLPTPTFVAGAYLKTLNLLERTKSRLDRIAGRLERKENSFESLQRSCASQFLLTELESGEKPARELIKLARSVGISERTLKRAKAEFGILSIQRILSDQRPLGSVH